MSVLDGFVSSVFSAIKMKNITYKSVAIYVDENANLIAIPFGESKKYGIASIDIILELKYPYEDQKLEVFLLEAINQSYTKKAKDDEINIIEKPD